MDEELIVYEEPIKKILEILGEKSTVYDARRILHCVESLLDWQTVHVSEIKKQFEERVVM